MQTSSRSEGSPKSSGAIREDLADRHLLWLILGAIALIVLFFALKPFLPAAFQRPGTPLLQAFAIAGAVLLLVPFAFVLMKRTGASPIPNRWFIGHVVAALAGVILVVMHSGGQLLKLPSTMLYALAGLVVSGVIARLRLSHKMASTLGTKVAAFRSPDPALQKVLRGLIGRKSAILAVLEPAAREATFSVNLVHFLRNPILAWSYALLARRESRLIGARGSVNPMQAWWRPVHLALAALFLSALLVHVVTVTFFAGYVAGGRPITWWHISAW